MSTTIRAPRVAWAIELLETETQIERRIETAWQNRATDLKGGITRWKSAK